jgi:hypothetical protein
MIIARVEVDFPIVPSFSLLSPTSRHNDLLHGAFSNLPTNRSSAWVGSRGVATADEIHWTLFQPLLVLVWRDSILLCSGGAFVEFIELAHVL